MKRYWQTAIEGIKAGTRIMVDEGFTCIKPYSVVVVKDDRPWWKFWGEPELYFGCTGDEDGGVGPIVEKHFLDGQIDSYEVESSGGHLSIDVYVGIVPEYTGWCYLIGDLLDAYWAEGDGWPEGPPSMVQAAIDATGWRYQREN